MKYRAAPVEVDAFRIELVVPHAIVNGVPGYIELHLENGDKRTAAPPLFARMIPTIGDYYVVQSDGYTYLNPKVVFERKYKLVPKPGTESSGEFLARLGVDADLWAAEFVKRFFITPGAPLDRDSLEGWFANAIEAGRAHAIDEIASGKR